MDDAVSVSSTVVKKPLMPLMRNVCGLDAVDEKWGETLVEADVEGTTLETDATNQSKWRNQSMSNLRKVESNVIMKMQQKHHCRTTGRVRK